MQSTLLCLDQSLQKSIPSEAQKRILRQKNETEKNIDTCKYIIEKLQNISMKMRQNISKFTEHVDPEIRTFALAPKLELKAYCDEIKERLKITNAHMDRNDLLKYLIGPDGYLFAYYGITVNESAGSFFFIHPTGATSKYFLTDEGPWALEERIRQNLSKSGRNYVLPERLIKTQSITLIISEKIKDLQKLIIPIINNKDRQIEEVQELKNIIVNHNHLERDYGITSNDLEIIFLLISSKQIVGSLNKWTKKTLFILRTDDFIFMLPREPAKMTADKEETTNHLAELKANAS